jgi:hypothetical protein
MDTDNLDELMSFGDVRVIRATAAALFCRIGDRNVWLPRGHVSGKLWCAGDRGRLFIRRWVARDRQLIDARGLVEAPRVRALPRNRLPAHLHLVPHDRRGMPSPRGAS